MRSVWGDDLVSLGVESQSQTSEVRYATFQVLSFSLSEFDILPGDILRLRLLEKDEIPTEISIVAVKIRQELLLRHFVPPRWLFMNTDRISRPMVLSPLTEIVAASACEEDAPYWRVWFG
jgi:hypothetical protein